MQQKTHRVTVNLTDQELEELQYVRGRRSLAATIAELLNDQLEFLKRKNNGEFRNHTTQRTQSTATRTPANSTWYDPTDAQ